MTRALETYHRKRRLVEALSTAAIIVMPFLNIFRLDIPTLRFYFFNSVLWLDEFLWVIVMFAMLYGRVWCGRMCPQTVVSELVRWWEGKTRRLFRVPRSGGALWRRGASLALVAAGTGAVSLFIGFNLVAFFVDPLSMLRDIAAGTLGVVTGGIIAGIAALVLVDGLYWREKFCAKACPYGMMQMLVTDGRTQIVQYRTERGEECIECKACLRVCSMGIDIRESPYQSECIQCGECVDACAQILARMDRPTLIRFSWGTREKSGGLAARLGFVDAKRWIMLALTLAYTVVLVFLISIRQPVSLSVSGDRSTLFRKGEDGRIYNDYSLKVSNRSLTDGAFTLQYVRGSAAPDCTLQIGENPVSLKSREVRMIRFSISTGGASLHPGPNRLMLKAMSVADTTVAASTEAVFFMPESPAGL